MTVQGMENVVNVWLITGTTMREFRAASFLKKPRLPMTEV